MFDRRWACAAIVLLLSLGATAVLADATAMWKGVEWTGDAAELFTPTGPDGNLVMLPDGTATMNGDHAGWAVSSSLPSGVWGGATPWISLSFSYPSTEDVSALLYASNVYFGVHDPELNGSSAASHYWGAYLDEFFGPLPGDPSYTFKVGRLPDGTVECWLNDALLGSTTPELDAELLFPDGDTLMLTATVPFGSARSVTFTDLSYGDDYDGDYDGETTSVPEPGTLGLLLALGAPGLMVWKKRRKRG